MSLWTSTTFRNKLNKIRLIILEYYDKNEKQIKIKSISKWDDFEAKDNGILDNEMMARRDKELQSLKQQIQTLNDNIKKNKQQCNNKLKVYESMAQK